jgi:hypothetical protein
VPAKFPQSPPSRRRQATGGNNDEKALEDGRFGCGLSDGAGGKTKRDVLDTIQQQGISGTAKATDNP